jgi:predicted MFS family arabinose efflux permease
MLKNYINNFKGFPREIWVLTIITFINRAGTMVVPFLSKYMKDDLHFSYSQIGWIMVCFGLGSIVGTWVSGKLIDKIGFYKIMVFSLFSSGIIFIALQQLKSFESLCIGIFILTSVADMFRPAMLVSLNSFTKKENRTRALTLVRAAVNLGFLFGPALGGLLIMNMGYEYLFYADGATCILAVLVFVVFVKEKKLPFKIKNKITSLGSKNIAFKDKSFVLHLFISMISGVLFFQIFTTLPLYHKEQFDLPEFYSGLLLGVNGLIMLFFELPIVNYVEKINANRLKVISIGVLLMAISFALLYFVKVQEILVIMMIFMTFGAMLTFPFANSFAMSRAHTGHEGKYMAIFTMSYSFAHIFSAKTGMEIIQKYGYETNWFFMSGLGFLAFIMIFWLNSVVKKEKNSTHDKIIKSLFMEN